MHAASAWSKTRSHTRSFAVSHPPCSLAPSLTDIDAFWDFIDARSSPSVSLSPRFAVVFGTVEQILYGGDFKDMLVRLFSTMASMIFFIFRLRAIHSLRVRRSILKASAQDVRVRLVRNLSWKLAAPLIVVSFVLFCLEMEGLASSTCSTDHPTWRYCKRRAFPVFHRVRPMWNPSIDPSACPCHMFQLLSTGLSRKDLEFVVEDAFNNSVYLAGFAMRNNTLSTPKLYPSVMRRHIDLYVLPACMHDYHCLTACLCLPARMLIVSSHVQMLLSGSSEICSDTRLPFCILSFCTYFNFII